MLKKIIISLLALSMLFSSTACDSSDVTLPTSGTTTTTTTPPPQLLPHEKVPKPYSSIYMNLDCLGTYKYSDLLPNESTHSNESKTYKGYSVVYQFDTYRICVDFIDKDRFMDEGSSYKKYGYYVFETETYSDGLASCPIFHNDQASYTCIKHISENTYFLYFDGCELFEHAYALSRIVFTHPEQPYVVVLKNALNGDRDGQMFNFWPEDSDHIVARMLNPETAVEATNEFWEIVFPDSAKSPAK